MHVPYGGATPSTPARPRGMSPGYEPEPRASIGSCSARCSARCGHQGSELPPMGAWYAGRVRVCVCVVLVSCTLCVRASESCVCRPVKSEGARGQCCGSISKECNVSSIRCNVSVDLSHDFDKDAGKDTGKKEKSVGLAEVRARHRETDREVRR